MKIEDIKNGEHISFVSERITVGNPVTGILEDQDDEWFGVSLTKQIEGLVNTWYPGEKKSFRKILCKKEFTIVPLPKK